MELNGISMRHPPQWLSKRPAHSEKVSVEQRSKRRIKLEKTIENEELHKSHSVDAEFV